MTEDTNGRSHRPSVGDHLVSGDDDAGNAVFRVVGRSADSVTLLRITDETGRRRHTGDTVTVSGEQFDGFDTTTDPDDDVSISRRLHTLGVGLWWSGRLIVETMWRRPLVSGLLVVLIVVGLAWTPSLPGPDYVSAVAIVLGLLGLGFLPRFGSRREE